MNFKHGYAFIIFFLLFHAADSRSQRVPVPSKGSASKVKPLVPKVNTKVFASASTSPRQTTTTSNGTTNILFDIDLGSLVLRKIKSDLIRNANGKEFSELSWQKYMSQEFPAAYTPIASGKTGAPSIPCICIPIAIPAGAKSITPLIQDKAKLEFTSTFLVPQAKTINDSTSEILYEAGKYISLPMLTTPQVSEQFTMRTVRMVTLTIPLATFDAASGKLTAKTKFKCGISFSGGSTNLSGKRNDPFFTDMNKRFVANPADLERFKVPFHTRLPSSGQSQQSSDGPKTFDKTVTNWIDPSSPYIKLAVTRTGLYRITSNEILQRSGYDIATWLSRDVRLFNKGIEVPVWIDTTSDGKVSGIEFFGKRLTGFTNEYYNWTTDSNAYWLTNSKIFQNAPVRYIPKTVTQTPTQTISEATLTLHHERDLDYYRGDGGSDETATLHRTDWIPGERFVWKIMQQDTSYLYDTLHLSVLPDNVSGKNAHLGISLRGISRTDGIRHLGEFFVNGVRVSRFNTFSDYDSLFHQADIPLSAFKIGENLVEVRFVTGTAPQDQWYVDFYEIALPSPIVPSIDTAVSKGQYDVSTSSSSIIKALKVSAQNPLSVYNLSDNTRLLTSNTQGSNLFVSDSSSTSNARYVAATSSSFLTPDRVVAWNVNGSRHWSDILDTLQGADYIIITHPEFSSQAQLLAANRKQTGLRIKVVTTDDVYNAFNFGSDEPWAIRRFLHYAFDFYANAPPGFVTLMGDGTWDPKFNLDNPYQSQENRTIHRSFIHPYGNPSSDYIFTTLEGEGLLDSLVPEMIITRIPIETPAEGDRFLQKLADYEGQAPAEWNKNFLLTIGGDKGIQHANLMDYADKYTNVPEAGGLGIAPINGKVTIVERTFFDQGTDLGHVPELQSAFRRGQSLAYFFGHGATFITDVFFGDPSLYRNTSLYPVFITLSCRTGAFAEPNAITLNEAFLRTDRGGVVMALGSTGFDSQVGADRLSSDIFTILRGYALTPHDQDSLWDSAHYRRPTLSPQKLNMAQVFTAAKVVNSVLQPVIDAGVFGWYNALQQNSILGDAMMGFVLCPQPEFNVVAKDIQLTDKNGNVKNVFSVSDSFVIAKVKVSNFGYAAETPVHIRIVDEQPGGRELVLIDTLERLDSNATVGAIFTLDSFAIGANTFRIKIDFDNKFAETEEKDNEAILQFQVNGFYAAPFFPPEGARAMCAIGIDSVHFTALVPFSTGQQSQVEIEVDTTSHFTSPRSLGKSSVNGLFFDISAARSSLPNPSSGVIWWRSRLIPSVGIPSPWQAASLDLRAGGKPSFSYSTGDQLEQTILSGLNVDPADGALFIPQTDTIIYDVISRGQLDSGASQFPISQILANSRPLYALTGAATAIAILTEDGSSLQDNTVYKFENPENPDDPNQLNPLLDSFLSVINSIPAGRKVIVFTNQQPFISHLHNSPLVKSAMQTLGSLNGFDGLDYFGAYALIGTKGGAPGTAKEKFANRGHNGVELFDTILTQGVGGAARTPPSAVATHYGTLSWSASNIVSDSSLRFKILGMPRVGGVFVPIRTISANGASTAGLSDIPSFTYPRLAVEMNFARSQSTTLSPKLKEIAFEYDPAPEFVIEKNSLVALPNPAEEGAKVISNYTVKNILCIDGANVPILLTRNFKGKTDTIRKNLISNFTGRSQLSFLDTLLTNGYQGDVNLTATVNLGNTINEQLAFNNTSSTVYSVGRDSIKPKLDVLYDRIHINCGDYVSSKVIINVRFVDKGAIRISDSASITAVIQELVNGATAHYLSGNSDDPNFTTTFIKYASGDLQGELIIEPKIPFKPGRYSISAQARDASSNTADTIECEFVVSGTNGFEHVMNYPNPFKEKTYITFILRSDGEADVKAVIYTIAGRKIRTLTLDKSHQRVGLNKLEWDGRDGEGNEIGNGTYLYRMVLNGKNSDGSESTDAITERAVKSK